MSMTQSRLSLRQNKNVERRQLPGSSKQSILTTRRLQLSDLSLDVFLRIQLYLPPQDIISFRKCCKAIYQSTKVKSTWLEALRNACAENQVFEPTFCKMKDMSRRSLEFSSMSPHLFLNKLRAHAQDPVYAQVPLQPAGVRILSSSPTGPAFSQVVLVPGGRYLLTTSLPSLIELWDLGDGSHMMRNKPIARCDVQGVDNGLDVSFDFTTIPTPDGTGFRILYLFSQHGAVIGSIYFYEIFPTSPEPEFILRRSLDLSAVELESMSCLQAYGDKLAFATRGRVVIWDFIQHSVSFFPVDFPAAGPIFLIQNDFIVVNRDDNFAIFRIPSLQALTATDTLPDLIDTAARRPVLQVLYPLHSVKFSWPLDWYGNVPFQIIGMEEITNERVTNTYIIEPVMHASGAVFCPIPMLKERVRTPESTISSSPGSTADEQFFTFSLSLAGGVNAMVARARSHQALTINILGEEKTEEVLLWNWREEDSGDDDQVWSLCPFSGRFCVLTARRREIRVLDFLRPPE